MVYSQQESEFIGKWMFLFIGGESLSASECTENVKFYFDKMVEKEKLTFENNYYKATEKFISKINYLKTFTKGKTNGCH